MDVAKVVSEKFMTNVITRQWLRFQRFHRVVVWKLASLSADEVDIALEGA